MPIHCPRCGDILTRNESGELECVRGQMPLSRHLESRLQECYVDELRAPRDIVFSYGSRPHGIGGVWFCPGCGVRAVEAAPGDLRCPACRRSLVEFAWEIIELHPHGKVEDS